MLIQGCGTTDLVLRMNRGPPVGGGPCPGDPFDGWNDNRSGTHIPREVFRGPGNMTGSVPG